MSKVERGIEVFVQPVIAGGIAYLGARMYYDDIAGTTIRVGGMDVPVWVFLVGSVGASNFVANATREWALSKLPKYEMWKGSEQMIVGPVLAGASTAAIFTLSGVSDGLLQPFMLGALSSGLGDYAYERVLRDMIKGEVKALRY